jgi:hypothetical protein
MTGGGGRGGDRGGDRVREEAATAPVGYTRATEESRLLFDWRLRSVVSRSPSMGTKRFRGGPFLSNTRGATLAEYAIMLFIVLCVAAIGFRVLGVTLEKKVGQANKHMTHQEGQTASAGDTTATSAAAAAGGGTAAPKPGSSDIGKDPTATGGGSESRDGGDEQQGSSLPMIARFALLALGVIGAAAAFLAISKGKPTA